MDIETIKSKVLNNENLTESDLNYLMKCDLAKLCEAANEIRIYFCNNNFDMCSIMNAKSGKCSENCKFCAQSQHYNTMCDNYPLISYETIAKEAKINEKYHINRFSLVTSGKKLCSEDIDKVCKIYKSLSENINIKLCASHGLQNYEDFKKLKESGVVRYHNNLETSERYFKNICTTHTYQDKINAIKNAQKAGLEICSGGIIGLGETMQDRIDMAIQLKALNIKSTPINILNPIKGTPFESNKLLTIEEIKRTIAIFRFILCDSVIRLAGGRTLMQDLGKECFKCGANGMITGNMLTTIGNQVSLDKKMIESLGFKI